MSTRLIVAAQDLDFEHLHETPGKEMALQLESHAPLAPRKRKNTFEDGFPDVEIDDLEFDEEDLKELDGVESSQKLPNGNLKCSHKCKDKTKYSPTNRTI
jgi:hypothetical protein